MRRVYLDNNATTPVLPEVFEAMRPVLRGAFRQRVFHPSSWAGDARGCRAGARIGGGASRVPLLRNRFHQRRHRGATISPFSGLVRAGDHVISSTIEHHAVLNSCKHLEAMGCEVTYVPVDGRGLVDPDDVRRAMCPNTRLITIMMANNETGVLQPVEEIGKIAAEADVYFHTDAVQAAGKVADRC